MPKCCKHCQDYKNCDQKGKCCDYCNYLVKSKCTYKDRKIRKTIEDVMSGAIELSNYRGDEYGIDEYDAYTVAE